ncbi:MAG: carboxypeptidase regulatory-like domain-containing protein [Candidatus Electryonea clarkiae]|nr:carboxypeptidase regulatory-like domain-containing protein [Candidatus Electryonea clarkiae]MDP8285088.1 carboxypeptidase regulatory-like domain-containing protein [Candidatus Electryonea clarkiae]
MIKCSTKINLLLFAIILPVGIGISVSKAFSAKAPDRSIALSRSTPRNYLIEANRRIDADSKVLLAQYNLHVPANHPDNVEAAKNYLIEQADYFGGTETVRNMKLIAVKRSPGGTHVHLQQTINGIPVYQGYFNVSFDKDNYINMLTANPIPGLSLKSTIPVLTMQDATDLTRSFLSGQGPDLAEPQGELVAYKDEAGMSHLAWSIHLTSMDPLGDWEVLWDATDGSRLEVVDHAKYHDGTGLIFNPDPLTTAEEEYGGDYVDNNDGDNDALNDERIEVTLNDISFEDGLYYLSGPYVEISDFEQPDIDPVTSDDPDNFIFTRSESGLEDVNVYYHIDLAQRHLQQLGFDDIQNAPIEVDPHGLNGADNSHYLGQLNAIAFGEGGIDDAEDADIIYHEYGHAIQADQIPNLGGGHMRDMGEGFCDYWAGTFSDRISDYNDTWFANWDGHNPFWNGRVLDYFGTFPDNWNNDIYNNGQIWSSCLWNIREDIGADEADAVIVQAHYYLEFGSTVEDGAEALLEADEALFDSEHRREIALNCFEKGFLDDIPGFSAIQGYVNDLETDDPIEGAEVEIEGEIKAETDDEGFFLVGDLQTDDYFVRVTAEGYGPWSDEVEVELNDTTDIMVYLAHPFPGVNHDSLDLTVPVEAVLDTVLILSNEGISDMLWSLRFHPEGVDPPEPWTLETELDLVEITGDENPYGCTVLDGNIIISGRNGLEDPAQFYILNIEGVLLDQVEQPAENAYGYHDLTTDGSLIYGSEGNWIVGIDLDGNPQDSIPSPYNQNRALAYDPDHDWFWCSLYLNEITAVDRNGDIQMELEINLAAWGLAWNPYDPDGMPLYVSGVIERNETNVTGIAKINPETQEISMALPIAEPGDQDSYSMFGTGISQAGIEGLEYYNVCQTVIYDSETETNWLRLYLLDTALPYADASPRFGLLEQAEEQRISLNFDALHLDPHAYLFSIDILHNGFDSPLSVPVTLNVHAVEVAKKQDIPSEFRVESAYPNPFNSTTTWTIHLPQKSPVELHIYNLLGQKVDYMRFEEVNAGVRKLDWNAPRFFSSGIYFVSIEFGNNNAKIMNKVMLLK